MRVFSPIGLVISAALALSACSGGGGGAGGKLAATRAEDLVLGKADAPVTITEYASASCSHCARFNNEVFPLVKTKYIDTGEVKYVLREILTAPQNVAAAGFLTARCAGEGPNGGEKAFAVLDAIYRDFENVVINDPRGSLLRIAQSSGMTQEQFDACVNDEAALKAMEERVKANSKDGVTGTPTFFVNGVKLGGDAGGEQTIEQLDAAIAAAKAGKDPAAAAKAAEPKQAS